MRPTLSACVITRDEETVLPRCLDAMRFVDEVVVVVDARSRDGSEKIARERADQVEVRAYAGDLDQKRYCVSRARGDWVLVVDPDEVVPLDLASELRAAIAAAEPDTAGFELNRAIFHLGRWIRHGDYHPDWTLRLFRPERARWVGIDPHARVVVEGRVRRLRGELLHFSYRDLADQVQRIQFFSSEAAAALDAAGRRARLADLVLRPPARFLRAYLLKRGFLDGVAGLVIAAATAFHVFLKYAKLWELQHAREASGSAHPPRHQ